MIFDEGIVHRYVINEGSLFGSHPGSVRIRKEVDLTKPVLDDPMDAEAEQEIGR